jgi:hypothetical protein
MTTPPKFGTALFSNLEGETARPWDDIEALYDGLNQTNEAFAPLARLARSLSHSPFVQAGLCGATSMHVLCIGPSKNVLQNPHLRIVFDFQLGSFWLIYVDGSLEPWCS